MTLSMIIHLCRVSAFLLFAVAVPGSRTAAAGPAIYYIHNDHLGTPRVVTDQLRDVKWRADYMPFGEAIVHTEDIEMPLRMPGQYYDRETGLHYNYFRDYDPAVGRYIQSDPIGLAGGLNTFSYASNNPLRNFDFFGLRNQGDGRRASGSRSVIEGNTSIFEKCQMDVTIASALVTAGAVGLIVRGYGFAAAATSATSGPVFALANALCPLESMPRSLPVEEPKEASNECED